MLNCVDPYHSFGKNVVKARVNGATYNQDISGAPDYEKLQLQYNREPQNSRIIVNTACGLDRIPIEPVTLLAIDMVESHLELQSGPYGIAVNNGTLESDICDSLDNEELECSMKSLFPEPLQPVKYKLPKRGMLSRYDSNTKSSDLCLEDDMYVVFKSQRINVDE
ncbi:lipid droplet localized protein-like [Ostrea edulis]|uniref:lipid droplet localized protein-like n=1 Tax=Ostrea edulis TaxID=37623 RepID=UPI0024AEA2C0|nr:lipid droplet localized protein-like [Ostrea edulis]